MKRPLTSESKKLKIHVWGSPVSPEYNSRTINLIQTDSEKIKEFNSGETHIFIKKETKYYAVGFNYCNQISDRPPDYYYSPKVLEFSLNVNISSVICGCDYTFYLTSNQEVYSLGLNQLGQLGLGHFNNVSKPTLIQSLLVFGAQKSNSQLNLQNKPLLNNGEFVQEIVCGTMHSFVLSNKGRIFSCGFGETYALGHGTNKTYNYFKEMECLADILRSIEGKKQIEKLQCGTSHSGIQISNHVFLWGMVTEDTAQIFQRPTRFSINQPILELVMGDLLTAVLTKNKEVFVMGSNIFGQLGINEKTHFSTVQPIKVSFPMEIDQIMSGLNHLFAINEQKNCIFAWGSNREGQINPFSQQDMFLEPTKQDWLCSQNAKYVLKCKGNFTFFFSQTTLQKEQGGETGGGGGGVDQSRELQLIKEDLESSQKECVMLRNENRKFKEEILNMKQILHENEFLSEQGPKKEEFDTNEELNHII